VCWEAFVHKAVTWIVRSRYVNTLICAYRFALYNSCAPSRLFSILQCFEFLVHGGSQVLDHALALQSAGCFSIVLECVPSPIAAAVTTALKIPTIGIGAGPVCSGQVTNTSLAILCFFGTALQCLCLLRRECLLLGLIFWCVCRSWCIMIFSA
jgi:hypothetical protein